MKEIVLFGAGRIGREVADILLYKGEKVAYFIDNKCAGTKICVWGNEIEVISFNTYLGLDIEAYNLVVSVGGKSMKQIQQQLLSENITDFVYYAEMDLTDKRQRIISYAAKEQMEDVFLYHVLKDEDNIFYIDIGSNDPFDCSVTKLFYDNKNACGINVEPQKILIEYSNVERLRDVNLCVGCGATNGTAVLYEQQQYSTVMADNAITKGVKKTEISIVTLKDICNQNLQEEQEISFLKVDVEGAEKSVLDGADFQKWRPWIIVMESTIPGTEIEKHEEWESILLDNQYHFVGAHGVNRYYVANEKSYLDDKFLDLDELRKIYKIYHADIELV